MSASPESRAKELFFEALDLPEEARGAFLEALARDDPTMALRVRGLLHAHGGRSAAELERVPTELGASLLGLLQKPGRRVGDYELLEEIGEGAFGSVWRARQVSLDRIVALKLLRSGRFAGPRDHERLRAEAEAVARLDHPHIVPIYEVGEADGSSYFSMKWIEGGALAERIATTWPPRRAALLMVDVARAVHHAHQRGLLHRDIKPSNVLLDCEGAPHVADFGIAKRLDGPASATTTNTLAGTPAYMAPEQADGGELTVATDVWALGCILYELLSARAAFKGDSITDTLRRVRHEEPTPLRKLRPDIPRDLETIVLLCLRKDASRRYPSADALADDLERWLEHEPIAARRASALERLQLFCRRSPLAATLIGVSSALVVLLAVVATWASFELGARLRDSYVGEARATRLSRVPGARAKALELLERAAAIRNGQDLRDETIASLALSDVVLERSVARPSGVDARVWADPALERVLLADLSGTRIVELHTGELIARIECPAEVTYARWSPNGRWLFLKHPLAGGAALPGQFSVWDARHYVALQSFAESTPGRSAHFNPKDEEFAYVSEAGELVFFDLLAVAERARVDLGRRAAGLTYRPDGEELALLFGDPDNRVQFRSARDGSLLREYPCAATPFEIAWLPGSSGVALACADARIRVHDEGAWDPPRLILTGHAAEVVDVLANPASALLASYSWDETTRVWDALTGRELRSLSARALGFDESGAQLAVVDAHAWSLWRLQHGDMLRAARAHAGKSPVALTFAPDGETIASAGPDGLWIWNCVSSAPPRQVLARELRSAAFIDGVDVLVAGGPDGLWRVDLRTPERSATVFDTPLWDIARSGSANVLAVQGTGEVHLLDTQSWTSRSRLVGAPHLEFLSVSRDGSRVAAGSWRGRGVHVWDVGGPAQARELFAEQSHIAAALSPDGRLLATCTGERFELASADSGAVLLGIERKRAFGVTPGPVAFSPTGSTVAFGLSSETVRLIEIPELRVWGDLTSPTPDALSDLVFSPDGARLAASCTTNLLQVWELRALERELAK